MPGLAVSLFKPCLNKDRPLRTQLLASFLSLAVVNVVLALAVVLVATFVIGNKAKIEARQSLEDQIKRHLTAASEEAAATIGERFRRIQYSVLDVTSFAMRDALQENLVLYGGAEGYPLTPAHTDLRDTAIADSPEANLVSFSRSGELVDLGRSVWYYSDNGTFAAVVPEPDEETIAKLARLDLLLPTMYINSNDTKAVYAAVILDTDDRPVFRYFPGTALSSREGTLYACDSEDQDGCYDATARPWYQDATDDLVGKSTETLMGNVIVTDPYVGAGEAEWMVTIARAVYGDAGDSYDELLGVVGADVLLEDLQASVEEINFLTSGFSILATDEDGTVVAANATLWNRTSEEDVTTVCELDAVDICSGDDGWTSVVSNGVDGGYTFSSADDEDYLLMASPVNATFDTDTGIGTPAFYMLSAVLREEIFEPASGMADRIWDSSLQIIITTSIVAIATLVAVGLAVCCVARNITKPIVKMTAAARSIAKDGAKTNVFGSIAADWTAGRFGASSHDGGSMSAASRRARLMDYLCCRGDDEITSLAREFELMVTGLGKRGAAAKATPIGGNAIYPKNPIVAALNRPASYAPSAPSAPPAR